MKLKPVRTFIQRIGSLNSVQLEGIKCSFGHIIERISLNIMISSSLKRMARLKKLPPLIIIDKRMKSL